MSSFGVTATGFSQKEAPDIQSEIDDDLRAAFGPETNLLADAVFGQIIGVFIDKLAENWEVLAAVYAAQFPDSATGAALDNIAALTGATRLAARASVATLDQIFLDGSVTLPAGRIVSVGELGGRFVTRVDVTNPNAFPTTVSVLGDSETVAPIPGFAGTIDKIVTPFAGWNAKAALTSATLETYNFSGGETLTVKVDGGAVQTVTFVVGDFAVPATATAAEVSARITTDLTGASAADAGGAPRITSDLDGSGSSIEVTGGTANALLGFATAIVKGFNSADVVLGRDIETDPDFRNRREDLLKVTGKATIDAIRAAVLLVDDVDESFVFENVTDVVDVNGVPAHSFETVIRGPLADNTEVSQAIFDTKAAGIQAFGDTVIPITDAQGFIHSIGFSRATKIPIFIIITVVTNTDPKTGPVYPTDGDAQVAAALASFGDFLGISRDVIAEQVKCEAFETSGVVDITVFFIDDAPAPAVSDNIPISSREIATFDTADIAVTSV